MRTEDSHKILKVLNSMTPIDTAEHLAEQNKQFNEVESIARDHQTFSTLMRESLEVSRRAFALSEDVNQQMQRLTSAIRLVPPDEGVRKALLVAADQIATGARLLDERSEQLRVRTNSLSTGIGNVVEMVSFFRMPVAWLCLFSAAMSLSISWSVHSLSSKVYHQTPNQPFAVDMKYQDGVLLVGVNLDSNGRPCKAGKGCGQWVVSSAQPVKAEQNK